MIQQRSRGIHTIACEFVEGIVLNPRPLDATDCDIQRINELVEVPKTGKSIRKQLPKTLDSNICLTYTAMGSGTLHAFGSSRKNIFNFWEAKGFNCSRPTQVIIIWFASGFTRPRFYGPCTFAEASVWSQ